MRSLVLAVLSLLLFACAMGPNYSRPDIPTSESFRMAEESKELPSLANMPWWELYRDEELQRLIRIALEENKDLKRAVASIDEFQARLFTARMDFAPQLSAAGNLPIARLGGFAVPGFPSPFSNYIQGSLAWELDIWGRIRRANEAGLAEVLAREENRRGVALQIVG
jgi:multidrug efflux system outer membrane protein